MSALTKEVESVIRECFAAMPFAAGATGAFHILTLDKHGELQQETVAEALKDFREVIVDVAAEYQRMRERLMKHDADLRTVGEFFLDVLARGSPKAAQP